MSSLFEVPHHLLLILSLAVSGEPGPLSSASGARAGAQYGHEGPLRFSEQVWLSALKSGAGGAELAGAAQRIFQTSSGRYYVPAEADRRSILSLRANGDIAALVAFDLARRNAKDLEARLGRAAAPIDLFLAHSMGTETALKLIVAAETTPDAETAVAVPEVGERVPEVLFHQGRPSRLRDLFARLKRAVRGPKAGQVAMAGGAPGKSMRILKPSVAEQGPSTARVSGGVVALGWSTIVLPAR